jgi:peptide/nickel transport system permease protein
VPRSPALAAQPCCRAPATSPGGSLGRAGAALLCWARFVGLAIWHWARAGVRLSGRGSLDDHGGRLATLVAAAACGLGVALWDLAVRRRRPLRQGGDSQWAIARAISAATRSRSPASAIVLLYLWRCSRRSSRRTTRSRRRDIVRLALPPGGEHWLGTDQFGRDVLSRIIYGARISLAIGFVATAISITLGTLIGAVAGYFGGVADAALMRFTDMVLAFPRLVLLIMIVALFEPSLTVIILVLGLTQWPGTTRIVRGEVLSLREREFMQAARALGLGRARIILRHVVPNVLAPVIVTATLGIGNTIVLEAGLVVPRPRRAAADADLGRHGRGRAREPDRRLVGGDVPRPRHRARRARVQPGGRWAARRPRPRLR